MNKNIYKQEICPECLQLLVNGESEHTPEELIQFNKTLDKWYKENYIALGPSNDNEAYFSWLNCDLCNSLPGNRFEYDFIDKS